MADMLHWGIIGTGNIARQFAAGVNSSRRGTLAAVGSRSQESANAFASAYRIGAAHGSYDGLLADKQVSAVYISLPNSMHHACTLRALKAGKHVLCEKPLGANAAEAEEMFDIAQKTGLVLIEAFMYRAHPLTHAVRQTLAGGAVGHLKLIRTSFCYRTTGISGNIRFDPALAGGALMDIGSYCINYARLLAGEPPSSVHAVGHLHESGVDDFAAGTLRFPGGVLSSFTCGMTVQADNTAYICGDEGYIEVPVPWKPPPHQAVYVTAHATPPRMDNPTSSAPAQPSRQTHIIDADMDLYGIEADDFAATTLDGKSPLMERQETIDNMRILDELRRQIGVKF